MKIAFIVYEFPKLSETFILNQITGMIDLGHEVDIFTFERGNLEKVHYEIIDYNLLSKVIYLNRVPKNKLIRILKPIKIIFRFGVFHP